jgi:hypothetical protein
MQKKQKIRFTYNAVTPGHGDVVNCETQITARTVLPTNWLNGLILRMFMDENEHKYFVNRIEGRIVIVDDAMLTVKGDS